VNVTKSVEAPEIAPAASKVAVLMNPRNASHVGFAAELKTVSRRLGAQLQTVPAASPDELEQAFAVMTKERSSSLLVLPLSWNCADSGDCESRGAPLLPKIRFNRLMGQLCVNP